MEDSADITLEDNQVASFHEHGFLRLGRLTTDRELAWLQTAYDEIVKGKMGYLPDDLCQKSTSYDDSPLVTILSPEQVIPELQGTILYRNVRKVFSRLFGVEETFFLTGWRLFLKPAHRGETPWHQDAAYRPPPHHGAGVWMPLDPVTHKNGCLQYIRGSQRGGLRPHYRQDDNLVAADVDLAHSTVCSLKPGEAVAHHCYTLHYAGPNTTDCARRAIGIVCQVMERR